MHKRGRTGRCGENTEAGDEKGMKRRKGQRTHATAQGPETFDPRYGNVIGFIPTAWRYLMREVPIGRTCLDPAPYPCDRVAFSGSDDGKHPTTTTTTTSDATLHSKWRRAVNY